MMYDQFVVFYFFDLSFMKLPLVALELCLKLFIVVILHLKHTFIAMTSKLCILKINITWAVNT